MEYHRGQTCGHTNRKVSVEIITDQDDFGILAESVIEQPTCSFFFKFTVPYTVEALTSNVIQKSALPGSFNHIIG